MFSKKVFVKLSFNPATINWSACTKYGQWTVMYLCVRGVEFVSAYNFPIGFETSCSGSVIFFVFHVLTSVFRKVLKRRIK